MLIIIITLLFPVRRLQHQSRSGTAVNTVSLMKAWRHQRDVMTSKMTAQGGRGSTATSAWAPPVCGSSTGYTATPSGIEPQCHQTWHIAPLAATSNDLPPPYWLHIRELTVRHFPP